ncbi:MAG: RICIN domain-containing protein [Fibrella sp.]|nr:RICIN domain-containing protein [Armatimonadota bacterium]
MKYLCWKKALAAFPAVVLLIGIVMLAAFAPGAAFASTSGIFGGGPLYINAANRINELKNSGFKEVVVWNIQVRPNGDLNFNGEFPLCSNGSYIGGSTHPDFAGNMAILKQGTVQRVTFSVGSSNVGDFQNIRDLVNSQGTGSGSILYRNFRALKTAIPALDAIDLDDENCYDLSTMVKFCVMLGNQGYKVALDPYTNAGFWTSVASQVNAQRGGTIDAIHLQCYDGGGGNNPCAWNFGGIPVYPGVWNNVDSPSSVQTKMTNWKNQCGISGGWMWLYDGFIGNAAQYAAAINNGIGPSTLINGVYEIAAATTGNALDCYGFGNTNGTPIQLWPYAGTNNQKWLVNSLNNGYYSIRTINPNGTIGRSLDCTGASPNNGTYIGLWDWNGGPWQQWQITATSGGRYKISTAGTKPDGTRNVLDGENCSGANNTRILLWPWSGGSCQQEWFFLLK